jgi:hypothetical protein
LSDWHIVLSNFIWSQTYDRDLQLQRCKNLKRQQVRFVNKNNFFLFEKTLYPTTMLALYL